MLATNVNGRLIDPDQFPDALDLASDQDKPSWIVDPDGKRIAALVPVEVLEFYEAAVGIRSLHGRHHAGAPSQN